MLRIVFAAAVLALASGCAASDLTPPRASPAASSRDLDCKPLLVGCDDPFDGMPPGEAHAPEFNRSSFNTSDFLLNVLLGG
jgi:hypothetical protein